MKHHDCLQKRILPLLLCLAFVFSSAFLTACDDNNDGGKTTETFTFADPGSNDPGSGPDLFAPEYTYPEVSPEDSLMKFDTYGGKYINPFTCETKDISQFGYSSYSRWMHDTYFNSPVGVIDQFIGWFYNVYDSNVPFRYFIRQAGTSRVFEYNYTPGNSCYISVQQEIDGETQSFPIIGIVNGEVVDNIQGLEDFSVDIPVNGGDIHNWINTLGLEDAVKETNACAIYTIAGKFFNLNNISVSNGNANLLPEYQGNSDGGVVLNASIPNGSVKFNMDCMLPNQIFITTDPLERVSFGPDGQSYTSPVTVLAGLYLDPELVNEVLQQKYAQAAEEAQ